MIYSSGTRKNVSLIDNLSELNYCNKITYSSLQCLNYKIKSDDTHVIIICIYKSTNRGL